MTDESPTILEVKYGKTVSSNGEHRRVSVRVPRESNDVDPNMMDAIFTHGLLHVTLGRSPGATDDARGQQSIDGTDVEYPDTAACLGYGTRQDHFSLALLFSCATVASEKLEEFCGRLGTLKVRRAGDAK